MLEELPKGHTRKGLLKKNADYSILSFYGENFSRIARCLKSALNIFSPQFWLKWCLGRKAALLLIRDHAVIQPVAEEQEDAGPPAGFAPAAPSRPGHGVSALETSEGDFCGHLFDWWTFWDPLPSAECPGPFLFVFTPSRLFTVRFTGRTETAHPGGRAVGAGEGGAGCPPPPKCQPRTRQRRGLPVPGPVGQPSRGHCGSGASRRGEPSAARLPLSVEGRVEQLSQPLV